MKYGVVIATRMEPDLPNTLANLAETCQGDMVPIVIEDIRGRGPQACRDEGILKAAAQGCGAVIIIDGHMRFQPGGLDRMAEHVNRHPKDVACAKCHHNAQLSFDDSPYCGARFVWKTEDRDQFWALNGKWRTKTTTGPIGCVMGACYAFDTDWYIDGLARPWQYGKGWGVDEEALSLVNWLCGGRNMLLDVEAAHLWRGQAGVPYPSTPQSMAMVWYNRLAFIHMLPLPEEWLEELTLHLKQNNAVRQHWPLIEAQLRSVDLREMQLHLEGQKRTMKQWRRSWCDDKSQAPTINDLRRRAKSAGLKLKPNMKAADIAAELKKLDQAQPDNCTTRCLESESRAPQTVKTVLTHALQPNQAQQEDLTQLPEVPPVNVVVKPVICPRCDNPNPYETYDSHRTGGAFERVRRKRCRFCGHKRNELVEGAT